MHLLTLEWGHTRSEKEPGVLGYKHRSPKKHGFSPYMKALGVTCSMSGEKILLTPFYLVTRLVTPTSCAQRRRSSRCTDWNFFIAWFLYLYSLFKDHMAVFRWIEYVKKKQFIGFSLYLRIPICYTIFMWENVKMRCGFGFWSFLDLGYMVSSRNWKILRLGKDITPKN